MIEYTGDIRAIECPKRKRDAYFAGLDRRSRSDTLADRISYGIELTTAESDSLLALLGKGCRIKTWRRLHWATRWIVSRGERFAVYERITFEGGSAYYCAGQCYTSEIRRLRETVLGI